MADINYAVLIVGGGAILIGLFLYIIF